MSLTLGPRKLDPKQYEYGEWIGHPRGGDGDSVSQELSDHRDEIEVFWEIEDDSADYSYDDWALIRFRGAFYLLNTSGSSCPSPCETWSVACGPATLAEVAGYLERYEGGVPERQRAEFAEAMAEVKQ